MFDCGMHMGYLDHRRYPDFSLISKSGDFNNALSCIIITHLYDTLPLLIVVCCVYIISGGARNFNEVIQKVNL